MERLRIRTASNVEIEYELANLWDRISATVIDHIIILSYATVIVLAFAGTAPFLQSEITSVLGVIAFIILMAPLVFYDLILEIFLNGQSFGKKIVKIKVIKMDGGQPTLGNYFLRWLLRLIDTALSYGSIAIVTILINGKGQRLGDIAAGTTVVKIKPSATLEDTIFTQIEEGYTPVFTTVDHLSVETMATIREVLTRTSTPKLMDPLTAEMVLNRTKQNLEQVLDIQSALPPADFLETVLKDYSALKLKSN